MDYDFFKDKTVLVTGGTGSFGSNFSKFLLEKTKLKKLVILSRDELKQFRLQKEMNNDPRVRFFLGDVRDLQRLNRAFHGVDVIVHAAALKQVPTLEYNPFEAVKTNVLGSQNVIDAAIDQGVSSVVLVSTDKAAQPVNLYGSTKLCAEKLFVSGNFYASGKTKFACVRYGNVVGSRGSIVESLLRNPNVDSVDITDDRMTRFWISLEEAFNTVFYALQNMEGGEIFVPKLPSMKLTDLFDVLAPNAKKRVVGIRPGEKLHEVLLTEEESRHAVEAKDFYIILPEHEDLLSRRGMAKYKKIAKSLPPGFRFRSDENKIFINREDFLKIVDSMKKTI